MTLATRPAIPEDWDDICRLLASTPMSAALPLVISRSSNRKLAYPSFGATQLDVVAHNRGHIVGYMHGAVDQRHVWQDGKLQPESLLYLGELRVAASHRGSGISHELVAEMKAAAATLGVHRGWCLVNEGNTAVLGLLRSAKHGGAAARLRTFTTCSRLLPWKPHTSRGHVQLEPIDRNGVDLAYVLAGLSHRFLAPTVTLDELRSLLELYPSIRMFRERHRPQTIIGLWDTHSARSLKFLKSPAWLKLARLGWNAAGIVTASTPFPKEGQPWKSVSVSLCSADTISPELEPAIAAAAFESGAHTVEVVETGLGPAPSEQRWRGPAARIRSEVLTFCFGERNLEPPECPMHVPVHVDLGFL